MSSDFERLTYTKAIELLLPHKDEFEFPVYWGCDLQSEHERYLTEHIFKKPVFLTGYPKEIKAFYMRLNDDVKTVAAMDLLVPGIGETYRRQSARRTSGRFVSAHRRNGGLNAKTTGGTPTFVVSAAPFTRAMVWVLNVW